VQILTLPQTTWFFRSILAERHTGKKEKRSGPGLVDPIMIFRHIGAMGLEPNSSTTPILERTLIFLSRSASTSFATSTRSGKGPPLIHRRPKALFNNSKKKDNLFFYLSIRNFRNAKSGRKNSTCESSFPFFIYYFCTTIGYHRMRFLL